MADRHTRGAAGEGEDHWAPIIAAQFAELLELDSDVDRERRLELLCGRNPSLSDSLRWAYRNSERRRHVPERIAGYRILGELGRGGMGIVYEAVRIDSGQAAAIKCMLPERRLSPQLLERFGREARLNAALTHPNCVFVYESGVFEDQPFFAMELLPGPDLETLVRQRGHLPMAEAIRCTLDIIDGLIAAHDIDVLHRDVKPGNCLLAADGRIKVADFGLSKSLHSSLRLTGEHVQLGTPGYAPPEQLRGEALDFRADVFGCGASLYRLLTGRLAFAGKTSGAVLENTFKGNIEAPDPALGLPTALLRWIERCLAPDREDRPADLRTMRAELAAMLPEHQQPARAFERVVSFFGDVALAWIASLLLGAIAYVAVPYPWLRSPVFGFIFQLNATWASWQNHLAVLVVGWVPYHTASTLLFGGSITQRMLGIRVLERGAVRRPGVARLFVRSLLFCGGLLVIAPLLTGLVFEYLIQESYFGNLIAVVAVAAVMFAPWLMRRRLVGLHELLSGTRTVSRFHEPSADHRVTPRSNPPEVDAVGEVPPLDNLVDLAPVAGIDRAYFATDASLQRRVIVLEAGAAAAVGPVFDEAPRPTRVRQLGLLRAADRSFRVMAKPAGAPLPAHLAENRGDWSWTRRILVQLLDELIASRDEGRLPARLGIGQLFVGTGARLQFMPWLPEGDELHDASSARGRLDFVAAVAAACVAPPAATTTAHEPIPLHASAYLAGLPGSHDLDAARAGLLAIADRRAAVTLRQRLLAIAGVAFVLLFLAMSLTTSLTQDVSSSCERALRHLQLRQAAALTTGLDADDVQAATTAAAELHRLIDERIRSSPLLIASGMAPGFRRWLDGTATAAFVFRDALQDRIPAELGFIAADSDPFAVGSGGDGSGREWRLWCLLVTVVLAVFAAFVSRGGIGLRLAGLAVVDASGCPVTRLRAALRVACVAVTMAVAVAVAEVLMAAGGTAALIGEAIVVAMYGAILAYPFLLFRDPRRQWQDRLLATCLVPR
ncbi:MAG: protein kinase [Planctomycetes bacterium]|nr:protein kinase [Planctomycetota bacterium]